MRKHWIDYLRVVAIVAVITIHASTPFYARFDAIGRLDWWVANLLNSASRFAVPLFVMISGALLLGRNLTIGEFYKKRAARLLPAIIAWNLLYAGLNIGVDVYDGIGTQNLTWHLWALFADGGAAVHLWYLSMFVCLMLFAPFINMFINGANPTSKDLGVLLGLMFVIFLLNGIANAAWEIWDEEIIWFKVFPWYIAYFIGGYYIDKYSTHITIKSHFVLFFLIILILFGAILNYYFMSSYRIIEDNLMLINTGPLIFLITAFIFLLAKKNSSILQQNKLISLIAEASFGMYLLHPVFLHLLERTLPMYYSHGLIYLPLNIFITTVASLVSIILLRKLSVMRKIC